MSGRLVTGFDSRQSCCHNKSLFQFVGKIAASCNSSHLQPFDWEPSVSSFIIYSSRFKGTGVDVNNAILRFLFCAVSPHKISQHLLTFISRQRPHGVYILFGVASRLTSSSCLMGKLRPSTCLLLVGGFV